MMNRYWYILLKEWRDQNKNGLTIPFLIGSQNFLPSKANFQNIHELIVDITSNTDIEVYITYCTDIDDLILGVRDESKTNIAGRFPFYRNKQQSRFFQTKITFDLGENVEEIIHNLNDRYQRNIDNEKYSRNDRTNGDYSSKDTDFIHRCFSKQLNNL